VAIKSFKAKPLDLGAEVETIEGVKVTLVPRNPRMSGKDVEEFSKKLTKIEDPMRDDKGEYPIAAEELALIYDKDAEWFATQLDFGTMRAVMNWIVDTLGEFGKGKAS
jgi:hypothetical protein